MFSPEVIRAMNEGTPLPSDDTIWCDACDYPAPNGIYLLPDFSKVCGECWAEYKALED